jgi:pimeloyl-ACP methyl ester carboxylesterase
MEHVDLPSLGMEFALPIFVFQGDRDFTAPAELVRTYVDRMVAPQKLLVLIAGGGHGAFISRSDEFLKLLLENVRPLAM